MVKYQTSIVFICHKGFKQHLRNHCQFLLNIKADLLETEIVLLPNTDVWNAIIHIGLALLHIQITHIK